MEDDQLFPKQKRRRVECINVPLEVSAEINSKCKNKKRKFEEKIAEVIHSLPFFFLSNFSIQYKYDRKLMVLIFIFSLHLEREVERTRNFPGERENEFFISKWIKYSPFYRL